MEKTIVCVLGMHRSGSSYVAGRIRGLGIDFGDDEELIAGDIYNERGYHENKDLSYLGEEILVAFGGDHIHPPFLESGWEKSLALEPLRAKAKYLIDKKFEDSEAWGWKDPRNSLLLPFWKRIVLPTHYIITIRNPLEVAESLLRRNGIAIRHGSELWFLHIASAIFHTRGFRRKFIFFDNARYSPLEVDEELRKFLFLNCDSAASGPTAGPEFSDSLVHHRETDEQAYANTDIHPLAKALYHALCQSHNAEDRSDFDFAHIPNEEQKYESWSILHLIETEPSLLINPHVLSNCLSPKRAINPNPTSKCGEQTTSLNQTISGGDEEIARLNQTVSERNERIAGLNQTISEGNEQIAALTQTLTERENTIHELRSDNERLGQEAHSLFATLEKVLQSKSWKLTRPLRGLSRFARRGMPTNSSMQLIDQIGRVIRKKSPVSFDVKAKCRTALLKFAAFYKEPLIYIADTIGFDWLVLQGVNKRNISSIEDRGSLIDQGAANLIIIGVKSLEVHLEQLRHVENSLIVIFDDRAADYVKLKCLRPGSSLVLVYDESSASRVRLVSDFPVLDAASAQAHGAVIAFHKNKSFILSTRKKEERYTLLPEKLTSRKKISRVLLQVDSFTQGGMENVVIDLAISLEKLGFEVSLAILGKEGVAAAKARDQGLKVTSFGSPPTKADYEDYLRRNKVGIVNAHFSIYGAEICAALDIPFLQTIHNAYVWFEPQTTAKYQLADQYTSRYICVSATAARYADVALGLDVRKMAIIPNGIDPNAIDHTRFNDNRMNLRNLWGVGSECPVFLNVASILTTKAQLPLVNAFSQVLETIPAAYLVLVGSVMEPAYQQEIEKQLDTLGIQNKVVLVGYDEYVAKYYHAADVFVLPSYWEGWSLSLGEAMANGLPSVITDVGSAYEFYGNERTEIIQAPFGDITQLNYLNLEQYIYGGDPEFEKRIAIAMIKASGKPRLGIDEYLRKKLDREVAYKKYATYFSELEH